MAAEMQQDVNFDPDKEFEFLERLGSGFVGFIKGSASRRDLQDFFSFCVCLPSVPRVKYGK
jgi:hypothetical protein